jgi:ABC-type dipeptide/oligopeptide/nickel transport system permease component
MRPWVVRRVGIALLQLAVLTLTVFLLIRLLPADPVARFVGMNASPEVYAAAQQRLGLDRPVAEQLWKFLRDDLAQGSLGRSWVSDAPVTQEIAAYLPITLELVLFAFALALLLAVPIGLWGALRPGGTVDRGTLFYGLFAGSQPEFVWGLLGIYVFFDLLGIAPGPLGRLSPLTEPPEVVTGFMTIDAVLAGRSDLLLESLWYLMLPVATLAFVLSGPIIKMVRENVARALRSEHVLYARACGLPEKAIARDALRSAAAPSMTLIGILFAFMLGGAVLIESVFSLGGLGQYAVRSILAFDYPAIQGVVLTISSISLGVYLLLDIAQAVIDPRVAP